MLYQLFKRTLEGKYVELSSSKASFRVEREGETLFVFFEKSNGATDWKNNLDFPAKPYRDMQNLWFAHRGFLRVFKSAEPYLRPHVMDFRTKRIVISGYSHGAALALLFHEYCVFNRPDIRENIVGFGFGCPRVVWLFQGKKLKARLKNFFVVRNGRDIVTHLPPRIFGYRHVGRVIKIGKDLSFNFIDAHRPENYLKALENWKGG